MPRVAEVIRLDIILVDRCCHDSVYQTILEVLTRALQALERSLSCFRGGYAELYGCLIAVASDKVQTSIFGLLRILNDIPLDITLLFIHGLHVLARYFGVAIHDRATYLADMGINQAFKDNLIPHAINIARCNCYCWFHCFMYFVLLARWAEIPTI